MGSKLKAALVNSRDTRRSDRNPLLEEEIVSIGSLGAFSPTDHAIKLRHCPLNDRSRVAPTRPAIPTPSNTIAFRGAPIHSDVNNPEIVAVMIMNI